jgi:hypothetical protein
MKKREERGRGREKGNVPARNLGTKVTRLYLLVLTEFPGYFPCPFNAALLRCTVLSPS